MLHQRPLILITNDDGYQAKGIRSLVEIARKIGDVLVVAPDGPRSGQSGAITAGSPIRLNPLVQEEGYTLYSCSGTPVDCVKLSMHHLLSRKPDLLLSGINHGSNAAVCVLYSGTMGAALEGCVVDIPSIGFSLLDHDADADFATHAVHIEAICRLTLQQGLPQRTCLNVNIPNLPQVKGVKMARQARGYWTEEYLHRTDPSGRPYFWLTGSFHNDEPNATDTDEYYLAQGYITVVPTSTDLTAHNMPTDFLEAL